MSRTILEEPDAMPPGIAEEILSNVAAAVRRNPGAWNRNYMFVGRQGKGFTPWR